MNEPGGAPCDMLCSAMLRVIVAESQNRSKSFCAGTNAAIESARAGAGVGGVVGPRDGALDGLPPEVVVIAGAGGAG